jgi:hypothetical protein
VLSDRERLDVSDRAGGRIGDRRIARLAGHDRRCDRGRAPFLCAAPRGSRTCSQRPSSAGHLGRRTSTRVGPQASHHLRTRTGPVSIRAEPALCARPPTAPPRRLPLDGSPTFRRHRGKVSAPSATEILARVNWSSSGRQGS